MPLWCFPSSFGSIQLTNWEMSFEKSQDGRHSGHFGHRYRTILAILNLYVSPLPSIKFRLNLTYGCGGDVVWRTSRWLPWRLSWISARNNFSNSESLCHCDASHRFGSIRLTIWEMSLEEFQDGAHLGYLNRMILTVLILCVTVMPPI